jgi:hypothetical protein
MELKEGEYIKDVMEHGQWAVFYDSHVPGRYLIARYSRSEVRTPFDIHWTDGGEYFSEVRPYAALRDFLILDKN